MADKSAFAEVDVRHCRKNVVILLLLGTLHIMYNFILW